MLYEFVFVCFHQDPQSKRSPHLVPYVNVDDAIKKANRQTASEIVKTLMTYGYTLEPPSNEAGESGKLSRENS